jgi:hypothetical protein
MYPYSSKVNEVFGWYYLTGGARLLVNLLLYKWELSPTVVYMPTTITAAPTTTPAPIVPDCSHIANCDGHGTCVLVADGGSNVRQSRD